MQMLLGCQSHQALTRRHTLSLVSLKSFLASHAHVDDVIICQLATGNAFIYLEGNTDIVLDSFLVQFKIYFR